MKNEKGNVAITVLSVILAGFLLCIVPLMDVASSNDDAAQAALQSATTELVNKVQNTGNLTLQQYEKFVEEISATGNAFEVEMEIWTLDENVSKKGTQTTTSKIGENVYYMVFKTTIMEVLEKNNVYRLKEGDIIKVRVTNTSPTLAGTLREVFYKVTGNDTYDLIAESSGTVTVNGSN